MSAIIHQAPPLESVRAALGRAALPSYDLSDFAMRHFFYSGTAAAPDGIIGVEFCDPDALLRSLVVIETSRSAGLGKALVSEAESYARLSGASSLYLLTTSAARYFERLGYLRVERAYAPPGIQMTAEFSTVCPSTAVLLMKSLCEEGVQGRRAIHE